ncbi:DDE-type integrase/transposase/recombinase [Candidatus Nomurabacteria bacterium]|nr:DDE-type integrase/transposase/recombinase [Candidatus Nomurabacteria bacterium]
MPRVRRDAADMVRRGYSKEEVGRRYGVGSSTICKWVKKAEKIGHHPIPTRSSRPKHHPKQLSNELVWKIFHQRLRHGRCAEVVHQELINQGIVVSLSSVKRTLDRTGLLKKRSPWKRYHPPVDRPYPLVAGDLMQIDTIHLMINKKERIYVFVLIDVYSRWVYAKCYKRMNSKICVDFVKEAERNASFKFKMLQSDHGPEFGKLFVRMIGKNHRYTRTGKPNDNAHIERMNRTLQEECIDKVRTNPRSINCALMKYLQYYNYERLHMGINLKTPSQLLINSVQAIG